MRLLSIATLGVVLACSLPLKADPQAGKGPALNEDILNNIPLGKAEQAMERLMTTRAHGSEFDKLVEQARKDGLSEQLILEARFAGAADKSDLGALANLAEEFEKFANYNAEDSQIFPRLCDWQAAGKFARAVSSHMQGNNDAFKQQVLEAYWLSPRQGTAFAHIIEKIKRKQSMQNINIAQDACLMDEKNQSFVILDKAQNKNALVLLFWSPESINAELIPEEYKLLEQKLAKNNFAVINIINQNAQFKSPDAVEFRQQVGQTQSIWAYDDNNDAIVKQLQIESVPAFVIVDNNGKILFNGELDDIEFEQILEQIVAAKNKPKTADPKAPSLPLKPAPALDNAKPTPQGAPATLPPAAAEKP